MRQKGFNIAKSGYLVWAMNQIALRNGGDGMLETLKKSIGTGIRDFLTYYTREPYSMEFRVSKCRLRGVNIDERVALYSGVIFDSVYPWLITVGDDCTLTGCEILAHDDSGMFYSTVNAK